jgi:hypothetical protein
MKSNPHKYFFYSSFGIFLLFVSFSVSPVLLAQSELAKQSGLEIAFQKSIDSIKAKQPKLDVPEFQKVDFDEDLSTLEVSTATVQDIPNLGGVSEDNAVVSDTPQKEDTDDLVEEYPAKDITFPDQIIEPTEKIADLIPTFNQILPQNQVLTGFLSTNIANNATNISTAQQLVVTFNQVPPADVVDSLKFYPEASFTKTLNGSTLTVTPTGNGLDRKTQYVFGLRGLGICMGENCSSKKEFWHYALRFNTKIAETKIVGYSIQNRPIYGHFYGNASGGGKSILLTGATHGEEWHAGGLWMLVDFMNNNLHEISNQNKELIIVPEVNVDGVLRQKQTGKYDTAARYNSRGVNLNRNFPVIWKACSACGAAPGSEPETQAVMNLTFAEKVTHTVIYHNQWPPHGIIFTGNDSNPQTQAWWSWTSARTGYPMGTYNGPEIVNSQGDVPGDQSVWSESVGVRALLIEGTYRGVTDWGKNFPMYLALLREF